MRWPSSGDGVRRGCPPTSVHRKGKTSNSSAEVGKPTAAKVAAAKRDAQLFWYARMCHPAIQALTGDLAADVGTFMAVLWLRTGLTWSGCEQMYGIAQPMRVGALRERSGGGAFSCRLHSPGLETEDSYFLRDSGLTGETFAALLTPRRQRQAPGVAPL